MIKLNALVPLLKLITGYFLLIISIKQLIPLTYAVNGDINLTAFQTIFYMRIIPAITSIAILMCGAYLIKNHTHGYGEN
jgi:hypothetical protein